MFARGNMNDGDKMRRKAMAFMGNLVAILSLVVIGYPLAPATIRTMLLGWILIVAAITRFILGRHCQPIGSPVTLSPVRVRSTDSQRLR